MHTYIYVHHLNDWLDQNTNPRIFSATELVLLGTSGVCAEGMPDFLELVTFMVCCQEGHPSSKINLVHYNQSQSPASTPLFIGILLQ